MSGFGYSDWSYDPFEKMVIFPPGQIAHTGTVETVPLLIRAWKKMPIFGYPF